MASASVTVMKALRTLVSLILLRDSFVRLEELTSRSRNFCPMEVIVSLRRSLSLISCSTAVDDDAVVVVAAEEEDMIDLLTIGGGRLKEQGCTRLTLLISRVK